MDGDIIPVVAACIIQYIGDDVFLLLHKKNEAADEQGIPRNPELVGQYEFAGGMMRKGESPEVALKREVHEELGVSYDIDRIQIIEALNNIYKDGKNYLVLYYECHLTKMMEAPDGSMWVMADRVKAFNCLPATYIIAQRYV